MNILPRFDNSSMDRFRGLCVQYIIIVLAFISGIFLQGSLSSEIKTTGTTFLSFIPFAILMAASIFVAFKKEARVYYPDELEDDEPDDAKDNITEPQRSS